MIYEDTMTGDGENTEAGRLRAVIECDKPGCPESIYMPGAGAYTAAERMRLLGWEVPQHLSDGMISGTVDGGRAKWWRGVRGYAARCPGHAQDAPVAHQHAWQRQHTLGFTACRLCGARRPE